MRNFKYTDAHSSLDYIQIVLLTLVFFLWGIGAKVLLTGAFVGAHCTEAILAFGTKEGEPTLFESFLTVTRLCLAIWLVAALCNIRTLKRPINAIFHIILLLCLLILQGIFHSFTVSDFTRPSGYVETTQSVWSWHNNQWRHEDTPYALSDYEEWAFAAPTLSHERSRHTQPQCVWRDEAILVDTYYYRDDGFVTLNEDEKAFRAKQKYVARLETLSPAKMLKQSWKFITLQHDGLEWFLNTQYYRPMTTDEITRYDMRKKCMENNLGIPGACMYQPYVDYEAVPYDLRPKKINNSR